MLLLVTILILILIWIIATIVTFQLVKILLNVKHIFVIYLSTTTTNTTNSCTVNINGELLISRIGLSRGYLNQGSKTADSFITNIDI